MIIFRHAEKCAGRPNGAGRLTGKCNCKTAKLDESARVQLLRLLGKFASASIRAGEESEYFALRLDALADQIVRDARGVRRTAKRSDKTTRLSTRHKKTTTRSRTTAKAVAR